MTSSVLGLASYLPVVHLTQGATAITRIDSLADVWLSTPSWTHGYRLPRGRMVIDSLVDAWLSTPSRSVGIDSLAERGYRLPVAHHMLYVAIVDVPGAIMDIRCLNDASATGSSPHDSV